MPPAQLANLIENSADIYKMSLGKNAVFRKEALKNNALVFGSEKKFYDAVVSGDEKQISERGRLVKADKYPSAGAPQNAFSVWRNSIETFRALPVSTLIVHWEADTDRLYWGITEGTFKIDREETDEMGQLSLVLHRPLVGGWQKNSLNGIPLSNLHPKARDIAINMATLNKVQTDAEYLRNLILDMDTSSWEAREDWRKKAREAGWHPKNREALLLRTPKPPTLPIVKEVADHFDDEIRRMAATALHTVAYANGQTVLATVKAKNTDFTRQQLEEEIASLFQVQKDCCALSGYKFQVSQKNPHLRPSLDRKDSSLGYVAGNLQIVTRAANFFKSASDEKDWVLKADAMERMAIAMQKRRKNENI